MRAALVLLPFGGEWNRVVKDSSFQAHCWVLRDQPVLGWFLGPHVSVNRQVRHLFVGWLSGRRGSDVWDRSYFENFTVDASIFVVTTSY